MKVRSAGSTGATWAAALHARWPLAPARGVLSPHAITYLVGADIGWNPVTNLNFDLELMYQHVNQDWPTALVGTVLGSGALRARAWQGDSSGFQGRLRITRYF